MKTRSRSISTRSSPCTPRGRNRLRTVVARTKPGKPAPIIARRRPSKKPVVNTLRGLVREWREQNYPGASATSQLLLGYWFDRAHRVRGTALPGGEEKDTGRKPGATWSYVFIPQSATDAMAGGSWPDLTRACATALDAMVRENELEQVAPLFVMAAAQDRRANLPEFIDQATIDALPDAARKAVEEAILMFEFLRKREGTNLAPVFTPLLGAIDGAAKGLVAGKLQPLVPGLPQDQRAWFEPYLQGAGSKRPEDYKRLAQNMRKTLMFGSGLMPVGLLRDCLDYALNDSARYTGVFESVREAFRFQGRKKVWEEVNAIYDFRNKYVAPQEVELTDAKAAGIALARWIKGLRLLATAGTQSDGK